MSSKTDCGVPTVICNHLESLGLMTFASWASALVPHLFCPLRFQCIDIDTRLRPITRLSNGGPSWFGRFLGPIKLLLRKPDGRWDFCYLNVHIWIQKSHYKNTYFGNMTYFQVLIATEHMDSNLGYNHCIFPTSRFPHPEALVLALEVIDSSLVADTSMHRPAMWRKTCTYFGCDLIDWTIIAIERYKAKIMCNQIYGTLQCHRYRLDSLKVRFIKIRYFAATSVHKMTFNTSLHRSILLKTRWLTQLCTNAFSASSIWYMICVRHHCACFFGCDIDDGRCDMDGLWVGSRRRASKLDRY